MTARLATLLLLASLVAGSGRAAAPGGDAGILPREHNYWPFFVRQEAPVERGVNAWTAAGPFLFRKPDATAEGGTASGFRPLWLQLYNGEGEFRAGHFLYPIFSYTVDEHTYHWSIYELIRQWGRRAGAPPPRSIFELRSEFEIFPLWFSRRSGDPDLTYWGLFPIYGTVKSKLGFERLSWVLFPLYLENESRGAVTTSTPWPVVRITRGAAHGWGVWPLFNYVDRPGVSRYETYLWPLGYNATRLPPPEAPPGTPPQREIGALPFYARSTGPGYISETYGWPFFGYTDRTEPVRYHELRYFWPFLVQGRGEQKYVNRWAPFYTHSVSKGVDKRWFPWPLLRHARWQDRDVLRTRTQLAYFVVWHESQRRAGAPEEATPAVLTHVWPLLSRWNNGAGREQWQFLSPFEVFFPGNEQIRLAWSPLFALARHEQRAPGDTRTSLLWNAITYEKRAGERRELHVGPLFSLTETPAGARVAFGSGLFGFRRSTATGGWRMFWLDFPRKPASTTPAPR